MITNKVKQLNMEDIKLQKKARNLGFILKTTNHKLIFMFDLPS